MTNPMSEGYPALLPAIYVDDCVAAIEFYKTVFGAEVIDKVEFGGKVFNAELRIGDSLFAVGDVLPMFGLASPKLGAGDTHSFHYHTHDVDGVWQKAVDAGAEIVNQPEDRFHGHRSGAVRDPFGHRWAIAKRVEVLTPAQMMERFTQAMKDGVKG